MQQGSESQQSRQRPTRHSRVGREASRKRAIEIIADLRFLCDRIKEEMKERPVWCSPAQFKHWVDSFFAKQSSDIISPATTTTRSGGIAPFDNADQCASGMALWLKQATS